MVFICFFPRLSAVNSVLPARCRCFLLFPVFVTSRIRSCNFFHGRELGVICYSILSLDFMSLPKNLRQMQDVASRVTLSGWGPIFLIQPTCGAGLSKFPLQQHDAEHFGSCSVASRRRLQAVCSTFCMRAID